MTSDDLRRGRSASSLSQVQAAARLGVSQSYLAMLERGSRRLTPKLARKAARLYGLPPSVLPPVAAVSSRQGPSADTLAADLAALGYPGFAHVRRSNRALRNPVEVLLAALSQDNLDARIVEALPWLVFHHWDLDGEWLVREAKLRDLQNRVGFVVSLATHLAERVPDDPRMRTLRALEAQLERSRLAREDTLCKATLPAPERKWLAEHRSPEALRWNLLTDWTADGLRYPSRAAISLA